MDLTKRTFYAKCAPPMLAGILGLSVSASPTICAAQSTAVTNDATSLNSLLARLPADWRPVYLRFKDLLRAPELYLKASDEERQTLILQSLSRIPGAEDFVLEHAFDGSVSKEGVAGLLDSMQSQPHWANYPPLMTALEHAALAETDPHLQLAVLDAIHVIDAQRMLNDLHERIQTISWMTDSAHQDEVKRFEQEEEQLNYIVEGVSLPAFLQTPPPVFDLKVRGTSIRVLAFGDFGYPFDSAQRKTAAAMLAYHEKKPFDFGITLGDNFYFDMTSPNDTRWKTVWEDLYGAMKIPFYPTFGNHDWGGDMTAAELLYSYKSADWVFPAPYYTYVAGPVQFFAINTEPSVEPSAAQLRWLRTELESSTAKWKVVYSHFPVYCSTYTDDSLVKKLMPVLTGRADIYISGHVHTLQQHEPEDGVNLFIIGGGGADLAAVNEKDPGTLFAKSVHGFGVLDASEKSFTVRFIGEDGAILRQATIHK